MVTMCSYLSKHRTIVEFLHEIQKQQYLQRVRVVVVMTVFNCSVAQ